MLSWLQHRWTGLYLLLMALGALLLFLYGFFPIKYHTGRIAHYPEDLPNFVDGISIDGQQVYNPGDTSVVLMVIDGIRYDYVTEEYMPYLGQLLRNKSACVYVSVAEPPTVTMPRIKAMMTGSISTFADVALNFGAPAVRGDSVLRAAAARGRRSVMYGDDTWLRLFPGLWAESDGTTSFYVTDYTEVDDNVTRHLDKVLAPGDNNAPSFDFLVLHYLGLDHIGHLEGARGTKIKPKLLEMDAVVKKIYEGMQKWNRAGVLFVCGDHGMRDAGGHGGGTPAEILVPLVVAKTNDFQCPYPHLSRGPMVAQVDLAPTIAWLLNAPAPGDNTGRPLPSLLPADTRQHLYLLHYVARRNAEAARAQLGEDVVEKEFYKQFQRAEKQFAQYLATGQQTAANIAKEFYDEALDKMAEILTQSTVSFDMFAIVSAIVLLYTITASLICVMLYSFQMEKRRISTTHRHKRTQAGATLAFTIILCCVTIILTLSCAITETTSSLCTINPYWIPAFIAIAVAFTITFFVTKTAIEQNFDLTIFKELNAIDYLLIGGTLFHAWSFFGTSFIEEEHMTWYFFWNTLMFFVLIRTVVVVVIYISKKLTGATEIQDKPVLLEKMITGVGVLPKWVLLIALHRYLRTMNQTGDRWLFLPDTADWLIAPENSLYLQAHLVVGTLLTLKACLYNLRFTNNYMYIHTVLTIAATAAILSYRVASSSLESRFFPILPVEYLDSVHIVDIFWTILAAQFIFEILTYIGFKTNTNQGMDSHKFVYNKPKAKTEDFTLIDEEEPWNSDEVKLNLARSISHILLNDMMLIVALLMRPHNVIMVPSVYVTCLLTSKCLDHKLLDPRPNRKTEVLDILSETLVHLWIGSVFFFYQGNSNSLASVDLAGGYVGLRAYCPVRVAARMGIHTYAGPALAGAALFARRAACAHSWTHYLHTVWQTTNIFALQRVYALSVYAVVAAVFREHLFVWTVFSPKLLYDFVATVFTTQALITIAEIIGITQFTARLARAVTFKTVP